LRRHSVRPLIKLVFLLGSVGIIYTLLYQPGEVIRKLLMMAFIIGAVYFIYQLLSRRRIGKDHSLYVKAVHQSKKLHLERGNKKSSTKPLRTKSGRTGARPSLQKKRKNTHLTVIEGKKGKKKNRAFF